MKTIATAAVLMMLAVPTWADEAENQTNHPANANDPIVLSEAEMDTVTAGRVFFNYHLFNTTPSDINSSEGTTFGAEVGVEFARRY